MKERIRIITIVVIATNIITSLAVLILCGWAYALGCLCTLAFYSEVPNTYNESYPFANSLRYYYLKREKPGIYCGIMGTIYALLYSYYLIMIIKAIF